MRLELLSKSELYLIEPLWKQLNLLHLQDSNFFKDHYQTFSFESRIKGFESIPDEDIRMECIMEEDTIFGYCISTVMMGRGEIDSLYISTELRGQGFGKELVSNALSWLKKRNCSPIIVKVAEGHEEVFGFYKEFGFYPRLTTLELK